MSESWHPRKTEKDVAVARAGVAKYDRGWIYGAGTREHDHSKPGKGGEVLNPEQLFTGSRNADVVIHTDGTTIYADGSDGEIVSGTDAFQVIQAAHDNMPDGGTLVIKPGVYDSTASNPVLRFSKNMSLIAPNVTLRCVVDRATWVRFEGMDFAYVFGLTLDCNLTLTGVALNVYGDATTQTSGITFDKLTIKDYPSGGIADGFFTVWDHANTIGSGNVKDVTFRDCTFKNYNTASDCAGVSYCRDVEFYDCLFDNARRLNFYGSENVKVFGGTWKNIDNYAALILQSNDVVVKGAMFYENTADDIMVRPLPAAQPGTAKDISIESIHKSTIGNSGAAVRVRNNDTYGCENVSIKVMCYGRGAGVVSDAYGGTNKDINIHDSLIQYCSNSGIGLGSDDVEDTIHNVRVKNCNQSGVGWPGINNRGTNTEIIDCKVYDDQATATQTISIKNAANNIRRIHGGLIDQALSITGGSIDEIIDLQGYTTENSGSASVADGDTIAHGLDETPSYVNLTASVDGHIAVATAVDATSITVGLVDDAGSAVGTAETVYWEAKS